MLSQEDMAALTAAEEKRLGVGSQEFTDRHNEIMSLIEQAQKDTPIRAANSDRGK